MKQIPGYDLNKKYVLLVVDLQKDFTDKEGKHYTPKQSIIFLKDVLFPYLKEHNIKVAEIISDYRQPRPGDIDDSCNPGTMGYESIVPNEIVKSQWIKCMNSPIWTRDNIGNPNKEAGLPKQDTKAFGDWIDKNLGKPEQVIPVLFGLTLDCCVLATLQELSWRGYYPLVLKEGVDHYSGKEEDKEYVLRTPVSNWARVITWEELKSKLG